MGARQVDHDFTQWVVVQVTPEHAMQIAEYVRVIGALRLQQHLRRVERTARNDYRATRHAPLGAGYPVAIGDGFHALLRRRPFEALDARAEAHLELAPALARSNGRRN